MLLERGCSKEQKHPRTNKDSGLPVLCVVPHLEALHTLHNQGWRGEILREWGWVKEVKRREAGSKGECNARWYGVNISRNNNK